MDLSLLTPQWLDAFFIAPFRWSASPYVGIWLGSAFLALYCTIIGEICGAFLFLLHRRYYTTMADDMIHHHNVSVDALHAGNKEAYLASNTMAQEAFGKSFFSQASIGISTLWPVPFALGWLAIRFEGILLYTIPGTNLKITYIFVFLSLYIIIRIYFSRHKKKLPLFRHIHDLKEKDKERRGIIKKFFQQTPSDSK